ncbi:MAG: hypothetical protein ABI134_26770, partial [Byssovorax sp.]
MKSTTLFSSVLGILLACAAALGSAGCTTDAFCFDNCAGGTGSDSTSSSGAGGAGGGILTGTG